MKEPHELRQIVPILSRVIHRFAEPASAHCRVGTSRRSNMRQKSGMCEIEPIL
jgi:hypothetical protein